MRRRWLLAALLVGAALCPLPPSRAQIVQLGCPAVQLVGTRGELDFVNGIYDKLFVAVNGRVAYKHRGRVPPDHPVVPDADLYIYWFIAGGERDWSIGPELGSSQNVFAFSTDDTLTPDTARRGTWQMRLDRTSLGFAITNSDVDCYTELSAPLVRTANLKFAVDFNGLNVHQNGEVIFGCSGSPQDSALNYNVYMVTHEAYETCDIRDPANILASLGVCDAAVKAIRLPLRDGIPELQTNRVLPLGPGTYYFLSVDGGQGIRGALPAGAPFEPGYLGLCRSDSMKVAIEIVPDVSRPVFDSCPGNVENTTMPGLGTSPAFWIPPTATDNVDSELHLQVALDSPYGGPGSLFPAGETTVEYIATDSAGNMAVCAFSVLIRDPEPPRFSTCPQQSAAVLDDGSPRGSAFWTEPVATDNVALGLETAGTHHPGDVFPLGSTVVTYSAVDAAGNQGAPCIFTVDVHAKPFMAPPSAGLQGTAAVRPGDRLVLYIATTGTPPITFTWSQGRRILPVSTNPLEIEAALLSDAGEYTLTAQNGFGVAVSQTLNVSVSSANPAPAPCSSGCAPPPDAATAVCTERGVCINGICELVHANDTLPCPASAQGERFCFGGQCVFKVVPPVDCVVSAWQPFVLSDTRVEVIQRERTTLVQPDANGAQCPPLTEEVDCLALGDAPPPDHTAGCERLAASNGSDDGSASGITSAVWFYPACVSVAALVVAVAVMACIMVRHRRQAKEKAEYDVSRSYINPNFQPDGPPVELETDGPYQESTPRPPLNYVELQHVTTRESSTSPTGSREESAEQHLPPLRPHRPERDSDKTIHSKLVAMDLPGFARRGSNRSTSSVASTTSRLSRRSSNAGKRRRHRPASKDPETVSMSAVSLDSFDRLADNIEGELAPGAGPMIRSASQYLEINGEKNPVWGAGSADDLSLGLKPNEIRHFQMQDQPELSRPTSILLDEEEGDYIRGLEMRPPRRRHPTLDDEGDSDATLERDSDEESYTDEESLILPTLAPPIVIQVGLEMSRM